jgi:hypothetical protein
LIKYNQSGDTLWTCSYDAPTSWKEIIIASVAEFIEGVYDIKYIKKAAKLLNKEEIINYFELFDGEGFGNLDKVYKHFDTKIAEITKQKIVLLYDGDINKKK